MMSRDLLRVLSAQAGKFDATIVRSLERIHASRAALRRLDMSLLRDAD